jgi:hypothetical protein
MASSIKLGHIQINPNFLFFQRERVFAMVVHNPIEDGRRCYYVSSSDRL